VAVRDERRSAASEAMGRYAEGDDQAFATVYDALAPRLLQFLTRMTRDTAAAQDLLQQTFLNMHLARARFAPGSAVEPWSFAIARRLFIDHVRRFRREIADGRWRDPMGHEANGEEVALAKELGATLNHELDALPPILREAFVLVKEQGLSLAEAAEVLGTTVPAVKLRAHRATVALRRVARPEAADVNSEDEP
jgi:RNA polymerase sigma-70 factor (ECF subfamily)